MDTSLLRRALCIIQNHHLVTFKDAADYFAAHEHRLFRLFLDCPLFFACYFAR